MTLLKDLLGNDHPLFAANLAQLERATGNAGVDTRLISDITEEAHKIIRALGLDVGDTTTIELYNALKNSVHTGRAEGLLSPRSFALLNGGDGPISFNFHDVVDNAHHELSFAQRRSGHAKRLLRLEIVRRYAEHDRTHHDMVYGLAQEVGIHQPDDELYKYAEAETPPSLLAIGDIFTDAFIKLREDKARIDTDPDGSKRLSMPFGNKPPYERVDIIQAVGPSPNAAVAFSRLGLRAGLLSFLGDDLPGKDSLAYLANEKVNTELVSVQKGIKSNYYYVLRYGADRTILVKNEDYEYAWRAPASEPDWIYLSLISGAAWQLHEDLLTYLQAHPNIKLAFQPGTFQFEWGVEKLAGIYRRSHIVVMNREEAMEVTGKPHDSIKVLADSLHALGPKVVVITDGTDGAYASFDNILLCMPNYPDPAPPYDRTGAGDAYASTIVAALASGETIEAALLWAPINSMSVVQQLGAQAGLLSRDELQEYLENAPADYKPRAYSD